VESGFFLAALVSSERQVFTFRLGGETIIKKNYSPALIWYFLPYPSF